MHKFFERQDAAFPFDVLTRVYALLIDGEGSGFVLFDAVAAEFFDQNYEPLSQPRPPGSWQQHADHAPIYAIEINASDAVTTAASWLKRHPHDALPRWSQIELVADDRGELPSVITSQDHHSGRGFLLERCNGPANNQNRSGIALWIWGAAGSDPDMRTSLHWPRARQSRALSWPITGADRPARHPPDPAWARRVRRSPMATATVTSIPWGARFNH